MAKKVSFSRAAYPDAKLVSEIGRVNEPLVETYALEIVPEIAA
jgi:hypothetical protein